MVVPRQRDCTFGSTSGPTSTLASASAALAAGAGVPRAIACGGSFAIDTTEATIHSAMAGDSAAATTFGQRRGSSPGGCACFMVFPIRERSRRAPLPYRRAVVAEQDKPAAGLEWCPRIISIDDVAWHLRARGGSGTYDRASQRRGEGTVSEINELIRQTNNGEPGARDRLFAASYDELRKLARSRLYDGGGRSNLLGTTTLVHETYLRLLRSMDLRSEDRRAYFAYASQVMRSVIVDTVRERQAQRRGGDADHVTMDTALLDSVPAGETEVLDVHEALQVLAQAEPRLARVVEMRYFGGYTEDEIAQALDVTERTVRRDWDKARLLLMAFLKK